MSRRRKRPGGAEVSSIVYDELTDAMPEAALQATVEGYLRFYGWRHLHVPDNKPRRTNGGREVRARITPGFPDVLAIRRIAGHGPELLIAELKATRGRYGNGQEAWLADFLALASAVDELVITEPYRLRTVEAPAIGVYTWRPAELASGEIERTLAGPEGVGIPVQK